MAGNLGGGKFCTGTVEGERGVKWWSYPHFPQGFPQDSGKDRWKLGKTARRRGFCTVAKPGAPERKKAPESGSLFFLELVARLERATC